MLRDLTTGAETRVPPDGLAILVGQKPNTEWADGLLARDGLGFLLTGADLPVAGDPRHVRGRQARPRGSSAAADAVWPLTRAPLFLETSVPGVFAAGDVRQGTPKRVASAVGDGALAVQLVHQYLNLYAAADVRALNDRGVLRDLPARAGLLKKLA